MDNQFDIIWVRAPKGTKSKWVRRAIQSGGSLSDYVLKAVNAHEALLSVLQELEESAEYWGEYDVPVGIQDRIKYALSQVKQ
jgi:thiamine monophosphate synthase